MRSTSFYSIKNYNWYHMKDTMVLISAISFRPVICMEQCHTSQPWKRNSEFVLTSSRTSIDYSFFHTGPIFLAGSSDIPKLYSVLWICRGQLSTLTVVFNLRFLFLFSVQQDFPRFFVFCNYLRKNVFKFSILLSSYITT